MEYRVIKLELLHLIIPMFRVFCDNQLELSWSVLESGLSKLESGPNLRGCLLLLKTLLGLTILEPGRTIHESGLTIPESGLPILE